MSKAKLSRWEKLVELAQIDLDKAAETLQLCQQNLLALEQQLNSLQDYSQEYNESRKERAFWTPAQLSTHNAFGMKVLDAMTSQQQKIVEQQEIVERAQQAWFEKRAHHKAMLTMYENLTQKELATENRREQKMMDELAAQKFFQSKTD